MKVLVTGGTGFLGSHLLDRLREDACLEIYALVRNPAKARRIGECDRISLLQGDLLNIPALPAGLDVVFHLAGLTKTCKSVEYYNVNQIGTASLLRAVAGLSGPPRVVLASSLAAGGPSPSGGAVREDDPPRPVSPYGLSKLAAEQEALKFRDVLPLAILRLGAVYGPRDEDFLEYFRMIRKGVLPLVGRREKSLSLCYVKDAVEAFLLASRPGTPGGEVFNIADGNATTWEEIGKTAARILGKKVIRLRVPLGAAFLACAASEAAGRMKGRATALNLGKYRDMKPDGWTADVRKAREVLGFETRTPLEAGLRETLDWYIRERLL